MQLDERNVIENKFILFQFVQTQTINMFSPESHKTVTAVASKIS